MKKDKKPAFDCVICDLLGHFEYYKKIASIEETALALQHFKFCNKHAEELQEIITKRESEAAAA